MVNAGNLNLLSPLKSSPVGARIFHAPTPFRGGDGDGLNPLDSSRGALV
jgi:hypothetical protein